MTIVSHHIRRDDLRGVHTADGKDTATRTYRTVFDTPMNDQFLVLAQQRAPLLTDRVPFDGAVFSATTAPNIFASTFSMSPVDRNLSVWDTVVNWVTPPNGDGDQVQPNPVFRPPVFNVEFIETEYAIELAENLVALPHGDGKGGERTANTLGDLVNAAGKRPDEPQVDTERNAVLIIERNFSSLAEIVALNEQYQRTTNSDAFQGFGVETLKYMVTDSLGQRTEGEFTYFPGVTRIEKKKTTKRIIANKGYAFWDAAAEGEPTGTPPTPTTGAITEGDDNVKDLWDLALDGTKPSKETWIEYRYLKRIPYAPLTA